MASSVQMILLCIALGIAAISLACAVGIGSRREVRPDPFAAPFGEMPGFTAEQLARLAPRPRNDDPQRRSFATRCLADDLSQSEPAGVALRRRAGGGFLSIPSRLAAARKFFRRSRHA